MKMFYRKPQTPALLHSSVMMHVEPWFYDWLASRAEANAVPEINFIRFMARVAVKVKVDL